ncbi:MAG TPA: SGNH/GDSL hydrolase family protein [bacterium]|nr:SGNH/GDSL hydrolase family protein [bacterium]
MQKKSYREAVFMFAVPILTVIIICSILELFSWLYVKYISIPTTAFEFRMKQPEPYHNAKYFSEDFVKESFLQPGGWDISPKTGDITPHDFNGKFFHIRNGRRVTAFNPEKHENTVFLFGGSTVYNSEVPDEYTVASQLQLLFNKFHPEKYIVQNFGITSFTTTQQLRMLKTVTEFRPGDIVIFYDGVNEIFLNIFYANPQSSMVKVAQRNLDTLSWLLKMMNKLAEISCFARLFLNPVDYGLPEHLGDEVFTQQMAELAQQEFTRNIIEAHKYSTEKGARFFHFLQPNFYSDDKYTKYEKTIKKNKYIMPGGVEESFKKGQPYLRKATAEFAESTNSFDLTGIFDGHAEGDEYFFDSVHVNHTANRVIAENIFNVIRNSE